MLIFNPSSEFIALNCSLFCLMLLWLDIVKTIFDSYLALRVGRLGNKCNNFGNKQFRYLTIIELSYILYLSSKSDYSLYGLKSVHAQTFLQYALC